MLFPLLSQPNLTQTIILLRQTFYAAQGEKKRGFYLVFPSSIVYVAALLFAYVTLIRRHKRYEIKASKNPHLYLVSDISLCALNHQTIWASLSHRDVSAHKLVIV